MKKILKKRAGFTLVELLIVIIIIGILAGAMLLVAGSGTDKAEATKIVSNLRSMKAAALMYYADNPSVNLATGNQIDSLKKYMDKSVGTGYLFQTGTTSGDVGWYVGLDPVSPEGAKDKLKLMADSVGLLNDAKVTGDSPVSADLYNAGTEVYMRAR
ncbi:prepilin-type N-terminal cleavage/methylation domain-containing protein [Aminivibrio sp.]